MSEQLPRARFTPMQRLFIEAYLVSSNLTKAAIAAGCKERSAHAVGWKWFNTAKIRAEIEARLTSTLDRYAVTGDRIIRELALIAFGNIGDFIAVQADDSLVVDFGTATRKQMASLKSVEIGAHERWRGAWRAQDQDQQDRQKTGPDGPGEDRAFAAGRSPRAQRRHRVSCQARAQN